MRQLAGRLAHDEELEDEPRCVPRVPQVEPDQPAVVPALGFVLVLRGRAAVEVPEQEHAHEFAGVDRAHVDEAPQPERELPDEVPMRPHRPDGDRPVHQDVPGRRVAVWLAVMEHREAPFRAHADQRVAQDVAR